MKTRKVKIIMETSEMNGTREQLYGNEIICQNYDVVGDALNDSCELLFDGQKLYGTVCTAKKDCVISTFCCTENGYYLRKIIDLENAFRNEEGLIKDEEEFNLLFESIDEDEIVEDPDKATYLKYESKYEDEIC